jgi:dipeptidyl aminopeptidase/acylaminoacyl peptidase
MKVFWRLILVSGLLVSPAVVRADLPPLIPRTVLFGNPEKIGPKISPDAKYLAYIAPDKKNVLQVWVRTIGKQDDRVLTADKKRGIRSFSWAYDGKHLLYSQDTAGDENFHVHAVNLETKEDRDLTPYKGVRAGVLAVNPDFPNEILVTMNKRSKREFDVYRLDLGKGEPELVTENPGNVIDWTADSKFRVRAALKSTPDGGTDLLLRAEPDAPWKTVRHWGPEESGAPLMFSKDGKSLYLEGNHDANAERLLKLDVASGKEEVIAEDPEYDVGGVFVQPVKRKIQAVSFNRDKVTWKVLDPSIAEDFKILAGLRKGAEFGVVSRDLADKTWLVSCVTDDGPVYYYVYHRDDKKADFLFTHQPKLEGLKLAHMQPVSIPSRDGLKLHGYLTTPVGVPAKGLPAVLLVHGGPWARDTWGFNPMVQWLANRGYAVLQVNYRGSTGYGKKFLNAGNREWARKMHDDLVDSTEWLVKKGVADPKKVAIMGGSYGGYATLVGLAFTPDLFACGVDIVGPSNLVSLLKTIPPYWGPMKAMFTKRVGDVEKEEDFLKERSPLFYVEKIKAPLLIGQGANDPRVKQAESDQIYEAMRKAGREVEYVIYKDEGHGFARPENRLHFYAIAEAFLAKHLGGRGEPVGEVKGHSAEIRGQ